MRFATLQQWLSWQESLHPSEIDLGLDRVAEVLRRMQLGEPAFTIISVAGTNGKGSCVAMLDAIYRAAGYRVGVYTSPHIKHYNERIVIAGEEVSDTDLCEVFEQIDQCRGDISLTYFEFGTLAAIALFQRANLDVAILEVGLGGRLDAVNILDADIALISSIDLDHQDWLGDTREQIALEKAGIARSHHPVVCGDVDPPESILTYLEKLDAPLYLINRDYHYARDGQGTWHWRTAQRNRASLPAPSLRGEVQLLNASTVLMAVQLLEQQLPVQQTAIRQGLVSTVLPARFQVLPGDIPVIIDVAHNPQGARALAATLQQWPCSGATHAVFGVLKDKDVAGIINAMQPVVDSWYVAGLQVSRAMPVDEVLNTLAQAGNCQSVSSHDSVKMAKDAALSAARAGDRVVVFGSFYVVSEVL